MSTSQEAGFKIDLNEVLAFATKAHANVVNKDGSIGQRRKYTNEPYIVHPVAVAGLVATTANVTDEEVAAALLHDVQEDTRNNPPETRVTNAIIKCRFGEGVALMVDWLTNKTTIEDGNWSQRAALECDRLACSPARVQTIKYADVYCNSLTVAELDPKFAPPYLAKQLALLDRLDLGDAGLRELAYAAVRAGLQLCANEPTDRAGRLVVRPSCG